MELRRTSAGSARMTRKKTAANTLQPSLVFAQSRFSKSTSSYPVSSILAITSPEKSNLIFTCPFSPTQAAPTRREPLLLPFCEAHTLYCGLVPAIAFLLSPTEYLARFVFADCKNLKIKSVKREEERPTPAAAHRFTDLAPIPVFADFLGPHSERHSSSFQNCFPNYAILTRKRKEQVIHILAEANRFARVNVMTTTKSRAAQELAEKRWEHVSVEDRKKHAIAMNKARWKNKPVHKSSKKVDKTALK